MEVPRARLTMELAKIRESQGRVAEAATILQELQVGMCVCVCACVCTVYVRVYVQCLYCMCMCMYSVCTVCACV